MSIRHRAGPRGSGLIDRRTLLIGGVGAWLACRPHREVSPVVQTHIRPLASLPTTTLPWLTLRDHFVATVGPNAGQGRPMGPLLVLADATFAPRSRFPLHGHSEMEILSIVLSGRLSHHGDQAHGASLEARTAQLISARDGMKHAEGNESASPTRMLQLWFEPETQGGSAAYFQRDFSRRGRQLIAGDAGMPLRCDVRVWWLDLERGRPESCGVEPGRAGYLLALDGVVETRAGTLAAGEGLEVLSGTLELDVPSACSALWIDLPNESRG